MYVSQIFKKNAKAIQININLQNKLKFDPEGMGQSVPKR